MLIIVISSVFSCSPSRQKMNAYENAIFDEWIGHTREQLTAQWGVPDSIRSDGKGGEILMYTEATDYQSVMNGNYTSKLYSPKKEMYINADSLIYSWKAWRRK